MISWLHGKRVGRSKKIPGTRNDNQGPGNREKSLSMRVPKKKKSGNLLLTSKKNLHARNNEAGSPKHKG